MHYPVDPLVVHQGLHTNKIGIVGSDWFVYAFRQSS